jgi:hypothetical protein
MVPAVRTAVDTLLAVRAAAIITALACAAGLTACGDTLQEKPIPHNVLEGLVVKPFPVYWLGGTFHGLSITAAEQDSSGAVTIQYGNCLEGGQGTCVPPLKIITSADNSFVPGGEAARRATQIRGVPATITERSRGIILDTGPVVMSIHAASAGLARAAARAAVPINRPLSPGAPLPAPQPDTGYGSTPLPSQEPQPLHPVR